MTLSKVDKAYLAGIIDGEGSIGIDNHGRVRSPSVRITVTNTNVELLEGLQSLWGGWLSSRRQRMSGWKAVSDLIWAGKPSSEILKAIQPYLRAKKEQCRLALLFNKTVSKSNTRGVPIKVQIYRQELRRKLLKQNRRGS